MKMNNKSILIGKGKECIKCTSIMDRLKHPVNWEPSNKQTFYFTEWDFCRKCRHLQHYEMYKIRK